ncbi:MAG: GSCFA domain-containing protein [Bacteroidales bacterium]|nr:GSCFA domain-containing protein [Bacteroidales bacterium]
MYYTPIHIKPFNKKIQYNDKLFFIGSCFSDEIARKLIDYKFAVISNPFGTLYNPISIYQSLQRITNQTHVTENDFFCEDDIYKSFHFHSKLADTNLNQLIEHANNIIANSYQFLKQASWIFITYGTSYVYIHKNTSDIVANCHKLPATTFEHRMLTAHEVNRAICSTIELLQHFNKNLSIVFTISPVRYLKYGSFENQVSKSLLFTSLYQAFQTYTSLLYFPAYEIFMDELRDYRYYATDMLHPSTDGIEHVWNKFKQYCIHENSYELLNKIHEIKQACLHKPMFPLSALYQKHAKSTLFKINQLELEYPFLNFNEEKNFLYEHLEKNNNNK